MLVRFNNYEKLKNYYFEYSKILSKIIRTAKKLYYNNKIIHVHNKIKATWKVINEDMGVNNGKKKERDEKINCENYSLKIKSDDSSNNHVTTNSPLNLFQICKLKYDNIIFQNTSTGEIETIIKKLP
jgi:hypothetical protein